MLYNSWDKRRGKVVTPSKVRIGPETFDIEFRTSSADGMLNDGSYGYTLDLGNLIVISSDISLSKQRVTLMHEILHAARMVFEGTPPKKSAEYEEWEHYFIGVYETTILMIMHNNKELMDWLIQDDN